MKNYLLAASIFFALLALPSLSFAKVLPQALKSGPVKSSGPAVATIGISAHLRADRRALLLNFSNLQNARAVSYSLIYNTSKQQEGAFGSVNLAGGVFAETEELLFGTCSKGVCTYHRGINNARLEVSYTLKSGKKYLRKYKIKV